MKYQWFGEAGYPPEECSGVPVINSFTATPDSVRSWDELLGENKDHNVLLSWDISNGDGVRLVADTGESAETTEHDPVIDGLQLLLQQTHTLTIYAKNECTEEADWPSKTLTIDYKQLNLAGVNLLLLNDFGNAPTT